MTGKTSDYLVLGLTYSDGRKRVLGSYKLQNDNYKAFARSAGNAVPQFVEEKLKNAG